jgi:hypothetical protein
VGVMAADPGRSPLRLCGGDMNQRTNVQRFDTGMAALMENVAWQPEPIRGSASGIGTGVRKGFLDRASPEWIFGCVCGEGLDP